MEKLLDVGNQAIKHAEKLGVDEAEIFLYMENHKSVKFAGGIFASRGGAVKGIKGSFMRLAESWIKKKGLPMITSGTRAGVGVRAIINKAIGFSSVSNIERERVLQATEEAMKIAKIRPPDKNWVSLPEQKQLIGKEGVFDDKIPDLDVETILNSCVDCCVTAGDVDKRITQAMAMISTASVFFGIVNTQGIELHDRGTFFFANVGTKAKSRNEEASSGEFVTSRTLIEDLRSTALSSSKRAIECFGRRSLPEKHVGQVVFENVSWNQLFSTIFPAGVSGLNVQENRSIYKGKIGKKVATENVSIVDDGTLSNGFGTAKTDDEGVPKQRTPIVEKGVLRSFLYDNYAAKREKHESTGNGIRQRFFDGTVAYANQPAIRPTNLMLIPEKGNLESLVREMKDGVLVKGSLIGTHTSNVVTGDFSVTTENAFKIENGEVAYPLKACTVAGNLYNALDADITIGDDPRSSLNVICPSVIVENVVVST